MIPFANSHESGALPVRTPAAPFSRTAGLYAAPRRPPIRRLALPGITARSAGGAGGSPLLRGCAALGGGLIALPDNAQALESEKLVDCFDVTRRAADQWRLASCCNHFRLGAHYFFHAVENAVDQIRVAVKEAGLHRCGRIAANDLSGIIDFHTEEARRSGKKRVGRNANARREDATQVLTVLRHRVKIDCRAEIDDDARTAIFFKGRDAIHDA